MTPEGFSTCSGRADPAGHRPIVRGDREVVALLKSWSTAHSRVRERPHGGSRGAVVLRDLERPIGT
jgi:hypothetical protein